MSNENHLGVQASEEEPPAVRLEAGLDGYSAARQEPEPAELLREEILTLFGAVRFWEKDSNWLKVRYLMRFALPVHCYVNDDSLNPNYGSCRHIQCICSDIELPLFKVSKVLTCLVSLKVLSLWYNEGCCMISYCSF